MKIKSHVYRLIRGSSLSIDDVPIDSAEEVRFEGGVMRSTNLFVTLSFDIGLDVYWDEGQSMALALFMVIYLLV